MGDDIIDCAQFINSDFGEMREVSYNTRDLITYAIGVGCKELSFVYENHDDFSAFPTYPIVFGFKGTDQDVVSFPSPFMTEGPMPPYLPGTKVGLDGERYIEKVNDLDPAGGTLYLRSKIIGINKKGSGASIETEDVLVDKEGKVFYKFVSGSFMVGAKGFKNAGVSRSENVPVPKRAPDSVVEEKTDLYATHIYRLSGDYNPLHIDPSFATMSGFGEPILHGLCSMGYACRHVMATYCGNNTSLFKALKVRFASPVLPGQTLVTKMWKQGSRVIFNTEVKETGKVVINNAYLDMQGECARPKL